ncbi:MAG: class I fructose-bisphosphate aldolase [bacterium]
MVDAKLQQATKQIVAKTILAADESTNTIKKRFDSIGVESTPEKNREYRQLLFTSKGLENFISGVILFDETINQKLDNNQTIPSFLLSKRISPGIKVDQGIEIIPSLNPDTYTRGLDSLNNKLMKYKKLGSVFAKWRAVFTISNNSPSNLSIMRNAKDLAQYASLCQKTGIVPIVEPEVLMDGVHSIKKDSEVTEKVLSAVFEQLLLYKIDLKAIILKPNMITAGSKNNEQVSIYAVAQNTLDVLRKTVPKKVPGIAFLSGGQSPDLATEHLNLINKIANKNKTNYPWRLTASYGRALQGEVLIVWKGKKGNEQAAQKVFIERAEKVYKASFGML